VQIAKVLGFTRAPGGHVFGVEINDELLAGRVFEPEVCGAGRGQREIRDLAAEL
jgi:hypothetical protein